MFEMHILNDYGKIQVKAFKEAMAIAVRDALDRMPEGREKAVFKTKIEEAMFFGTKAIASKEGNFESIQDF